MKEETDRPYSPRKSLLMKRFATVTLVLALSALSLTACDGNGSCQASGGFSEVTAADIQMKGGGGGGHSSGGHSSSGHASGESGAHGTTSEGTSGGSTSSGSRFFPWMGGHSSSSCPSPSPSTDPKR